MDAAGRDHRGRSASDGARLRHQAGRARRGRWLRSAAVADRHCARVCRRRSGGRARGCAAHRRVASAAGRVAQRRAPSRSDVLCAATVAHGREAAVLARGVCGRRRWSRAARGDWSPRPRWQSDPFEREVRRGRRRVHRLWPRAVDRDRSAPWLQGRLERGSRRLAHRGVGLWRNQCRARVRRRRDRRHWRQ